MSPNRLFRATATTGSWYNEGESEARNLEAHIRVSLSGDITSNRLMIAKAATSILQRLVWERYGRKIPPDKIKIQFEREELSLTSSPNAQVDPIEFNYRGPIKSAHRLPSMMVDITKLPRPESAFGFGTRPRRRERRKPRRRLLWRLTHRKRVKKKPVWRQRRQRRRPAKHTRTSRLRLKQRRRSKRSRKKTF